MLASLAGREHALLGLDIALDVLGGLIALAAVIWWLRAGRPDPLRGSPLRPNRLTPMWVWICLCAQVLAWWVAGVVAGLRSPGDQSSEQVDTQSMVIASSVAQVLIVVVCLVVARLTFVNGWKGFGIGRRPLVRDVVGAVAPWLVSLAVCTGVYWMSAVLVKRIYPRFVEPEHPILQSLRAPSTPVGLRLLAVAGALVLAPISEELFFRGILQSGIKKLSFVHWGSMRHRWIAIGVTAALFGGVHFATPQQIPALIVLGLILGYLYERRGSLILPILVHVLFNARTLLWNALIYGV